MAGQSTSSAPRQLRTSPTRRRIRRRLVALVVAVGLLGPALAASPAVASGGVVSLQAILNSSDFLAAVMGAGPEITTPVTYEVFEAAGDGVVPLASEIVPGLQGVNIPLPSGDYKISASAPGFVENWFTSAAGATDEPWSDLIGYHEPHDFASAGVITVDTENPENSTWAFQAWTVLHQSAASISGAVGDDLGFGSDSLAPGVVVGLYDAAAGPDSDPVATVVTDEYGYYSFDNPPVPGSYTVRFEAMVAGEPVTQWWPETAHRGEAETIALAAGTNYTLAYGLFAGSPPVDTQRVLVLSGEAAPGQTLTAVPDYADTGGITGACGQRYTWLIDGDRVPEAFGDTFVVPGGTNGRTISARLDIVGLGCTYTALLSNPIGPVDASLTLEGDGVEVTPVDQDGNTDVALVFGSVDVPGVTTVATSGDGPAPIGFSLRTDPPVYYFIETTAVFDPEAEVEVCITFDTSGMSEEAAARQSLYHFVDGGWVDITETQAIGEVCGLTTSFSPFVVGQAHWPFRGFLQPVDNGATANAMKAGAAVPIKFGLGGSRGLDVLTAGSPVSEAVSCTDASAVDNVEQTVSAGASSLSYNAVADTYSYVWKTQKGWAGTCRLFELRLTDGSVHSALFAFTK